MPGRCNPQQIDSGIFLCDERNVADTVRHDPPGGKHPPAQQIIYLYLNISLGIPEVKTIGGPLHQSSTSIAARRNIL